MAERISLSILAYPTPNCPGFWTVKVEHCEATDRRPRKAVALALKKYANSVLEALEALEERMDDVNITVEKVDFKGESWFKVIIRLKSELVATAHGRSDSRALGFAFAELSTKLLNGTVTSWLECDSQI